MADLRVYLQQFVLHLLAPFFLVASLTASSCPESLTHFDESVRMLNSPAAFEVFRASPLVRGLASELLERRVNDPILVNELWNDFHDFNTAIRSMPESLERYLHLLQRVAKDQRRAKPGKSLEEVVAGFWHQSFVQPLPRLALLGPQISSGLKSVGLNPQEIAPMKIERFERFMAILEQETIEVREIHTEIRGMEHTGRPIHLDELLRFVEGREKLATAALALYAGTTGIEQRISDLRSFIRQEIIHDISDELRVLVPLESQTLGTESSPLSRFSLAQERWRQNLKPALQKILTP